MSELPPSNAMTFQDFVTRLQDAGWESIHDAQWDGAQDLYDDWFAPSSSEPQPAASKESGMPVTRLVAMRVVQKNLRAEGQTSRANCVGELIDEVERLHQRMTELDRCLKHYQARFSLITTAWRAGDNSAVLDAVRKHITAKDCEDADRLARATAEPRPAPHVQVELPEGDNRDAKVWFTEWRQGTLHICIEVAQPSQPPLHSEGTEEAESWISYLEAEPKSEPYLAIARALRDLVQFHDWALPQITRPPQRACPHTPDGKHATHDGGPDCRYCDGIAQPPSVWRSVENDPPPKTAEVVLAFTGEAYLAEYGHDVMASYHTLWMPIPALPSSGITKGAD